MAVFATVAVAPVAPTVFDGEYFSGTASNGSNTSYLELLDIARRMISPADTHFQTPTGVLDDVQNGMTEGAQWAGNFWTQNSYGFGLASAPFLDASQSRHLETAYNWWFDHRGDGGQQYGGFADVPAGMLCDNGSPTGCNYMQCGPGRSALLTTRRYGLGGAANDTGSFPLGNNAKQQSKRQESIESNKILAPGGEHRLGDTAALGHDWIIEGTLAGSLMKAEMLLANRNVTGAQVTSNRTVAHC